MSSTMKAVVNETYGGPEVLEVQEVPVPTPSAGEVRVRVHAASINPVDVKVRSGKSLAAQYGARPVILGYDVSGVVDALGEVPAAIDRALGLHPEFEPVQRAFAAKAMGDTSPEAATRAARAVLAALG